MSEQSDHAPEPSESEKERAAETESYGGVPISEEELGRVWETGSDPDPQDGPHGNADPDSER